MRYNHLAHEFVDNIPERLAPGVLYVSVRYATVAHLCCCGCGSEIVTPLAPAQWQVIFDGETVSLHPSIGNWNLQCRSHYVIRNNQIIEAEQWSEEEVAYGEARDKRARAAYYESRKSLPQATTTKELLAAPQVVLGWWVRLRHYFLSKN
jgi:hypothetical protein